MCFTPLTNKCYITLAQAMGMQYGGAPTRPAGTGKTETIKNMGKTINMSVLVTNCAPEHRYKNMGRNFQRNIQIVLFLLFKIVVKRIKKDLNSLSLLYTDIELNPSMGYFITINPGYSGRQELPENLKILFRVVTLMAPNRESIISMKLCSYGIENHDDISNPSENYMNYVKLNYQNNNIMILV